MSWGDHCADRGDPWWSCENPVAITLPVSRAGASLPGTPQAPVPLRFALSFEPVVCVDQADGNLNPPRSGQPDRMASPGRHDPKKGGPMWRRSRKERFLLVSAALFGGLLAGCGGGHDGYGQLPLSATLQGTSFGTLPILRRACQGGGSPVSLVFRYCPPDFGASALAGKGSVTVPSRYASPRRLP